MTVYQTITYTTGAAHGLAVGSTVIVAGVTPGAYNGTFTVYAVPSPTTFKILYNSSVDPGAVTVAGTATTQGPSLARNQNQVTATTAAAHGFAIGYQVAIAGFTGATLASLAAAPTGAVRDGNGTVTFATTAAHGIPVGATIAVTGVTDTSFNGQFTVLTATSTAFTVAQAGSAATSGSGSVQDVWNGTFILTAVPTTTTFVYKQIGKNDQTSASGTATVQGQVVAGQRKCVLMFQTRNGFITAPSPPVVLNSSGGQQVLAQNIAVGPANTIARVLAFTGAGGDNYFTILATPTIGGGTALLIPDNTTTSAVVDFGDNTLFAATAIDIPGNNLFAQQTLRPCLGVFSYASRMFWWGFRNVVLNFINLSFDGGYLAGALTQPLGWTVGTTGGTLIAGGAWAAGLAWRITGDGSGNELGALSQSCYQDQNNIAILTAKTAYTFRGWAKRSGATNGNIVAEIFSASGGGVLASATIAVSSVTTLGGFVEAAFSVQLTSVPADAVLNVYAINLTIGATVTLDEMEVMFAENPYALVARASYASNPEAFDGTTGTIGPDDDSTPIQCLSQLRNALFFKTQQGIFQTQDSPGNGPAFWTFNEISRQVGALSFRSGDPGMFGTGDAGEEWDVTAARGGLYIFAGGELFKLSQEEQPVWDSINWAHAHTIWVKNDVLTRRVYVALPTGAATSPNLLLVLDYRELDTAHQIGNSPPIHISFTGKMIASDLTRKWTTWNLACPSGEILVRPGNVHEFSLGGAGNIYYLDPAKLTDDDFGAIVPYYTTYFFVEHEQEEQLQVGSHRKLYVFLAFSATGTGTFTATPLANTLSGARAPTPPVTLGAVSNYDLGFGLNVTGAERCAFRFAVSPLPSQTDVQFNINKVVVTMRPDLMTPVRGAI